MAILLVQEFTGIGQSEYEGVIGELGLGIGDDSGWPDDIISHVAGPTEDGWCIVDRWKSIEAFEAFMADRLGPAIERAGGMPEPRVTVAQIFNRYPAT